MFTRVAISTLFLLAGVIIPSAGTAARAQDCNNNGIADECDIDCGEPGGPCDLPGCGQSEHCNGNGVSDECDRPGDHDGDWNIDLTDLAALLANYGTTSGMTYADGDIDGDGDVDLAALLAVYGTTCPQPTRAVRAST